MALLKENINNFITDDLNKRNQNWETIDDSLELKADKTYVDSQVQAVTKSDVGLSNVTNDKQMPISGGVLENYTEKLGDLNTAMGPENNMVTILLGTGNTFVVDLSILGMINLLIPSGVEGVAHSFTLIINMGSTVRTVIFPPSVKWQGGEIPDMTTTGKTYVLTFMTVNGGTTWLGMFGGEF